ncbi:Uncharacterized protein DAT39_021239, partial [Clarias magur]
YGGKVSSLGAARIVCHPVSTARRGSLSLYFISTSSGCFLALGKKQLKFNNRAAETKNK